MATKDGSGDRLTVNSFRRRKGSSAVVSRRLIDRAIERGRRRQHDQPFEHAHARAGQVIGEFLERDRAQALPG